MRHFIILLFILLNNTFLYCQIKNEKSKEDFKIAFFKIDSLIKKLNYEKAFLIADELIKKYPEKSYPHYLKTNIFVNSEAWDSAVVEFKKYINMNSAIKSDHYLQLSIYLISAKKFDESIYFSRKALELESNNGNAFNNIGVALELKKQYRAAINNFITALSFNPKSSITYSNIATTYLDLKILDSAEYYYNKAYDWDYKNIDAQLGFGKLYYVKERYFQAKNLFDVVIKNNPKNNQALYYRGISYYKLGNINEACKDLESVKDSDYQHLYKLDTICNKSF